MRVLLLVANTFERIDIEVSIEKKLKSLKFIKLGASKQLFVHIFSNSKQMEVLFTTIKIGVFKSDDVRDMDGFNLI